jgi:hypothetical protein
MLFLIGASVSGASVLAAPVWVTAALFGLAFFIKAATAISAKEASLRTEDKREIKVKSLDPVIATLRRKINMIVNPSGTSKPLTQEAFVQENNKTKEEAVQAKERAAAAEAEAARANQQLADMRASQEQFQAQILAHLGININKAVVDNA